LKQFEIEECKRNYEKNKCWDPVDLAKEGCDRFKLCMNQTATGNTTSSKVLLRLAVETLNDFTDNV
jgi:hypothetical protein